jgi:hypothetical protein
MLMICMITSIAIKETVIKINKNTFLKLNSGDLKFRRQFCLKITSVTIQQI